MKVRRALLSVHDKTGLADFARALRNLGIELVAVDGTEQYLRDEGVDVVGIEQAIGAKALAGAGAVQTLNPQLQQAIVWGQGSGLTVDSALNAVGGSANGGSNGAHDGHFDMIVMNLNPFERVANRHRNREDEVVSAIDIDGPAILRAAAKNYERVVVVADPEMYSIILEELEQTECDPSYDVRKLLASRAFDSTAHYELAIANWFNEVEDFPTYLLRDYVKMFDLPYGENPHQRAAYYVEVGARRHLLSRVEQLHGDDLTFNNLNDLHCARGLVADFTIPCCTIVKHAAPLGCAVSSDAATAFERAISADELSTYGGVIALNRPVDAATAKRITERYYEVVYAPGYSDEAIEILKQREELKVLLDQERRKKSPGERDMRRVVGGLLVQDTDSDLEERDFMDIMTTAQPSEAQWGDLLFAWRVAKWVPSSAIVLAKDLTVVGIGGGSPNRNECLETALRKAGDNARGAMLASDSFFAYEDAPQLAIEAGIIGAIQPGGSRRDDDVISLFDQASLPMVFTHRRHFRH